MLATASQVVTRPSFARASRARDRRRVHVVSISAASSSSASPPGAPAGDDAAPTAPNTPFVSPEAAMRGDVAREWISDVYDAIDYERVMAEADALAADAGISNDDEDAELMYGEFDAGFFVALIESLEPELRALEEGDVDGGAVVNGSFVDIGSGRGQIAVLASVLRTWQRCVGLEYLPVLHAIADQVALTLPDDGVLDDARVACLPNALRQSPLTFIRGDMYDDTDLAAALEGATLVFLFSTKIRHAGGFRGGLVVGRRFGRVGEKRGDAVGIFAAAAAPSRGGDGGHRQQQVTGSGRVRTRARRGRAGCRANRGERRVRVARRAGGVRRVKDEKDQDSVVTRVVRVFVWVRWVWVCTTPRVGTILASRGTYAEALSDGAGIPSRRKLPSSLLRLSPLLPSRTSLRLSHAPSPPPAFRHPATFPSPSPRHRAT